MLRPHLRRHHRPPRSPCRLHRPWPARPMPRSPNQPSRHQARVEARCPTATGGSVPGEPDPMGGTSSSRRIHSRSRPRWRSCCTATTSSTATGSSTSSFVTPCVAGRSSSTRAGRPALPIRVPDRSTSNCLSPPGTADAYDWNFCWKTWDALRSAASDGTDRTYGLGDTPGHRDNGNWSDGTPIAPLKIQDSAPIGP